MTKKKFTLSVLATFVFVIACATGAQAQAQRTFVAGPGIGLDTNNTVGQGYCSFSNPCRNFSVAYGVTNIGGEIIAVSPGVGYGGLNITHAITVTGLPGQVAFVAITSGATGFSISAPTLDLVVVRDIHFNGAGANTTTGLSHTGGKLIVKNCVFENLTTGVSVTNAKMDLIGSDFFNNGTAVSASGTGTDSQPGNISTTQVRIAFGNIIGNTVGLKMLNTSNPGFFNIWFFALGGQTHTPNVIGNTTGAQRCDPGCATIQNIQSFGANTILP